MNKPYTPKQGQYLAFICYYGKSTGARLPKPKCNNTSESLRRLFTR